MSDINSLTEKYIKYASAHGEYSYEGNSSGANKSYKKLMTTVKSLLLEGPQGESVLLDFLSHENVSVRLWSATHVLSFDESSALVCLQDICTGSSFFRFDAQMVIQEWKAGRLIPIPD